MKKLIAIALCLLCTHAYSQDVKPVVDQQKVSAAFKELYGKESQDNSKSNFYDKRVDPNNLDGDGLFGSIEKKENDFNLWFCVYHKDMNPTHAYINSITITAGTLVYPLLHMRQMKGNGTALAYYVNMGYTPEGVNNTAYKVMKAIVTSESGTIQYQTLDGTVNHSLSKREIKEIKTIVDAWEALQGM